MRSHAKSVRNGLTDLQYLTAFCHETAQTPAEQKRAARRSDSLQSWFAGAINSDVDPDQVRAWQSRTSAESAAVVQASTTAAARTVADQVAPVVVDFTADLRRRLRPLAAARTVLPRVIEVGTLDPTPLLDGGTTGAHAYYADRLPPAPAPDGPTEVGPLAASLDHDAQARRALAYRLQHAAARLMSHERIAFCHRFSQGGAAVQVRAAEGRAYLSGLQTCGSVWMCPCCAPKITEVRRAEIQQLADETRRDGGQLLMLTLTIPHQQGDQLKEIGADGEDVGMLSRLSAAWRFFVSGRNALSRILEPFRYYGFVRALEVTHGSNGWHPHFHVLVSIGVPLSDVQALMLEDTLHARWAKATKKHGFGDIARAGLRLDVAPVVAGDEQPSKLGDYIAKWGVAEELTKLHTKQGRSESRTPWRLLADYAEGDRTAGALWAEYAGAFKGRRQIFWSRGLRDLCGLGPDVSDEQLAAAEPEQHQVVVEVSRTEWIAVRAVGSRAQLLNWSEYGPQHARRYLADMVRLYLERYGSLPRLRLEDEQPYMIALEELKALEV